MIPALGYMIGAYIIFRAFEMWSKPNEAFDGAGSKWAMRLLAIAVLVITGIMISSINQSSAVIPQLPQLSR